MNKGKSRIFKVSIVLKLRGAQAAVGSAKKPRAAQSVPSQEQNSVQNDYVKICQLLSLPSRSSLTNKYMNYRGGLTISRILLVLEKEKMKAVLFKLLMMP
jgi:hypothetical protein